MELLWQLLSSDHDAIPDLRAQRGVRADTIHELQRFYELKVGAGAEPAQITMTGGRSEAHRDHTKLFPYGDLRY